MRPARRNFVCPGSPEGMCVHPRNCLRGYEAPNKNAHSHVYLACRIMGGRTRWDVIRTPEPRRHNLPPTCGLGCPVCKLKRQAPPQQRPEFPSLAPTHAHLNFLNTHFRPSGDECVALGILSQPYCNFESYNFDGPAVPLTHLKEPHDRLGNITNYFALLGRPTNPFDQQKWSTSPHTNSNSLPKPQKCLFEIYEWAYCGTSPRDESGLRRACLNARF